MNEPQYDPPSGERISLPSPTSGKRKVWPWVAGVVLLVGVLTFAGCGFLGYRLVKSPSGTGTLFAAAIQRGDVAGAYGSLCGRSKAEISFDEFEAEYVPTQKVKSIEPASVLLSGSGDSDEYVVTFVLADESRKTVEYPLAKESGEWRVCDPPKL